MGQNKFNQRGYDLSLEEQYEVVPRMMKLKQSSHITAEDVEDFAQDVIIYHWLSGRPLPLHFFYQDVRQRIWNVFKPRRKMAKTLREGVYLSQPTSQFEEPITYAEVIPDPNDWEESLALREAFKKLSTYKWGRKVLTAAMERGQKKQRPVRELGRALRTEKHRREFEEIFDGIVTK